MAAEQKFSGSPKDIVRSIQHHLGGTPYGVFDLQGTPVTMFAQASPNLRRGTEYGLDVHHPIPESSKFSSQGILIVSFPRSIKAPSVREVLRPTTIKKGHYVDSSDWNWRRDRLPYNKKQPKLRIQTDLAEYTEYLGDKNLLRVDKELQRDLEQDRILGEQVWQRAKRLHAIAVATENTHRHAAGHGLVGQDFIANYQIGTIAARIHYDPAKKGINEARYRIDFFAGDGVPYEDYHVDEKNGLRQRIEIEQGRIGFDKPSAQKGSQLLSTLTAFDVNDLMG